VNCLQVQDMLPAYALGALDAAERDAVESHVASCSTCIPLARDYLQAVASLSHAAQEVNPPAHLRARILQQVAVTPQLAPIADLPAPRQPQAPRLGRPWSLSLWAATAAACISLVVAAALLSAVSDLRSQVKALRDDNQRVADMLDQQRELSYTLAIPGMETMVLKSVQTTSTARGMMMVNKDRTWGVLVSQGLKQQPAMGYQVWLIRDGQRVSGGVFTVDESGYGMLSLKFPQPLTQFTAIGVTIEPISGSPGPTGAQVFSAPIQQS